MIKFLIKGKFIQVKNAQCYPKMVDEKNFLKISAGFSKDGREFAAKKFDILLTMFSKLENLKKNNQEIIDLGKKNNKNIQIFSPIHIICKNSKMRHKNFTICIVKINKILDQLITLLATLLGQKKIF